MPPMQSQDAWAMPIAAVVKAKPTIIRLGALGAMMPAAYRNSVGMHVTIRQTGWPSLDGKTFRVSAWKDGDVASFPDLTLENSDTTGETGTNPSRADGIISIPQTLPNFGRYPPQ